VWLTFDSSGTVFRTLDNGSSWSNVGNTSLLSVSDSAYGYIFNQSANTVGLPIFYAVGNGGASYSSNCGKGWRSALLPFTSVNGIAYGNGIWVAVGNTGSPSNNIAYSIDGSNWNTANGDSFGGYGNKVAYGNGNFIAVGYQGCNVATIYTSTDGINWSSNATTLTSELLSITYGPGVWITNSYNTIYISSDNGNTWGSIGTLLSIKKIIYADETVAATTSGIYYSADQGSSFGSISGSNLNSATSIAYGNGVYIAVGTIGISNVIMKSSGVNTISYSLEPSAIQPRVRSGSF
jgi:hypothetical protein